MPSKFYDVMEKLLSPSCYSLINDVDAATFKRFLAFKKDLNYYMVIRPMVNDYMVMMVSAVMMHSKVVWCMGMVVMRSQWEL